MPALALIFHLIEIADGKNRSGAITKQCALAAVSWCDYLEQHARRIYESSLSLAYQAARKLARKIQSGVLGSSFDVRQVYRKEWSLLKNKEEVQSACEILAEAGWIKISTSSGKGRANLHYEINPKGVA